MTAAENIKSNLMAAIRYVETKKHRFTRNPGRDFTRNRKLGMGDTITALISMNGGTLQRELHKYAAAGGAEISPSAFCQSRAKIKPEAFAVVFHRFNQSCKDNKTTTYMLLMVLVSIWQGTPALHALSVTKVTWKDIVNSI